MTIIDGPVARTNPVPTATASASIPNTRTEKTATDDTQPWIKCTGCRILIYAKRLERHQHVCPECQTHLRIDVDRRLSYLLDPGSTVGFGEQLAPVDPLGFVDTKPYAARVAAAQRATGRSDSVICCTATIEGEPVVVAAFDFGFMGGSLGSVAGELITVAAELALRNRIPLLVITASGGARMQEGALSLMQMAKTARAFAELHDAGVLAVNLNTHPTYGGATASFATLGDVILTEPGALTGFAGPRVIQQTIATQLPLGFQTAAFQLEHGLVDAVVSRENLRGVVAGLLRAHGEQGQLPPPPAPVVLTRPEQITERPPQQLTALARDINRPTTLEYIGGIFDGFTELHGDRRTADDPAMVAGLARLGGRSVVVVGTQKGHSTRELVDRRFGMPLPAGYLKALRMYRHAARFGLPVVSFIDTPGAYPGAEAEQRGQGHVIAECIAEMSMLKVPTVCVITGEGGSGGALALGVGNTVFMLENAYYSVISPEGCSSILWGDASRAPDAAANLRIDARSLLGLGVVDGVLPEPPGGAHLQPGDTVETVRSAVLNALDRWSRCTPEEISKHRQARFRTLGALSGTVDLPVIDHDRNFIPGLTLEES
ncbi:MAG TPA: acetyl-CoA carboxylase, carboxyltransferase subunit beta [Kineosporiaceae bacterium]|nr:acetyl-CoA carboxylase, carboxyltransferase subunit beta [Kineosporiaceae bacterium]